MAIDPQEIIPGLGGNPAEKQVATKILTQLDAAAVPALLSAIEHAEMSIAIEAVNILAVIRDKRALPLLLQTVEAEHPLLAGQAVHAVAAYPETDDILGLFDALPRVSVIIQQTILVALQRRSDPTVAPYIVSYLETTKSALMRSATIKTLIKLGDPDVLPAITPFLSDPDHHVREWASEAVKVLKTSS
ncbi:MAG: hypothetical protein GYB68_05595 [Chloroflexi bacterium]|nr:hypothetical protein [Chloroflexota bacterium]